MRASETNLRNLLEGCKQFQIPIFQRPYAWEKPNWETLWTDLMSIYNGKIEGSHFIGSIVTQAISGTADGISPFIVIDGQQRLVTLTILLATLRHYLQKEKKTQDANELFELYLINKFKQDDDRYKVFPSQHDCEVYQSIINSKNKRNITPKEGKIYDAYKFFEGKLKKPFDDEERTIETAKIKSILLERLTLVNITSEEKDNVYLIFESLNNKGQELTQTDLIRNYIFMQLELPAEEKEKIYQTKWLPLENKFKDNKGKKDINELTKAFWFYLRKDNDSIAEKGIYQALKKKIDNSENGIQTELDELIRFVNYYQRLNFENQEPELKLRQWFQRLIRLDFKTCQIFLLNIYRDYEDSRLSLEDFEKILCYLESYFVRRLFAEIPTNILGKLFDRLYEEVTKENPKNLVDGLYKVLKKYDKNKSWPEDTKFREGIINKTLYRKNGSNDRVKSILERLEGFENKERVNPEDLTIEHIMPQNINRSAEWKKILGSKHKDIHKKWVHTLGNLTLTGYNPELSNKPFEAKKEIYQESNISLNKYFRDLENWNEEEIKKRAEKLADLAIKVWPR